MVEPVRAASGAGRTARTLWDMSKQVRPRGPGGLMGGRVDGGGGGPGEVVGPAAGAEADGRGGSDG